jgi:mannosyltransferase OCH1-like enzyme
MIPKIIHYCWFGENQLTKIEQKCVASWKKYFPDYEIKKWNESNYNVHKIVYIDEAYAAKKYAFVSDYARFDILYQYGGLYFDTDVEVIKPFDDILSRGAFMGCENQGSIITVNPGLGLASPPGLDIYKEILNVYSKLSFINIDGDFNLTTVVQYTTEVLKNYGLANKDEIQNIQGITIYPKEYFCPDLLFLKLTKLSKNTHSIHHYAGSWLTGKNRIKNIIYKFIIKYPVLAYFYAKFYR